MVSLKVAAAALSGIWSRDLRRLSRDYQVIITRYIIYETVWGGGSLGVHKIQAHISCSSSPASFLSCVFTVTQCFCFVAMGRQTQEEIEGESILYFCATIVSLVEVWVWVRRWGGVHGGSGYRTMILTKNPLFLFLNLIECMIALILSKWMKARWQKTEIWFGLGGA